MAIGGTVRFGGGATSAAAALRQAQNEATTAGNAAALGHWHEQYVPLHFEELAYARYNYQPRKGQTERAYVPSARGTVLRGGNSFYGQARVRPNPKYFHRKLREKGTRDPLVYSGRSKADAQTFRVTARPDRAVGAFVAMSKYFWQFRKDLGAPDKADELTRLTLGEVADMARVAERAANDLLAARLRRAAG